MSIKVAVIGTGIMGKLHARAISEGHGEELAAVCDINEESAKKTAEEYNAAFFTSHREMFEKTDIDAVCIATPDSFHAGPVLEAIKYGKHVLVEKPLATDSAESKKILNAGELSGKVLMVNFTHRWAHSYSKAKEEIDKGILGDPLSIYARKFDPLSIPCDMIKSWAHTTSPARFLSCHDIDLAVWFFNSEVVKVYANGVKKLLVSLGIDTYDVIQAVVEFKNGATGIFESGWIYPDSFPTLTDSNIMLTGVKGSIVLDRKCENIEIASTDKYYYPKTGITSIIDGRLRGAFKYAHEHFINCIINGRKPMTDAHCGHHVSMVTDGIHESLEKGIPVEIKEF